MSTAHVFLTRYNLPSEGVESMIRAKEGWLRERTELFERYTVPSVRAQLGEDIHWIVYLDTQSPQWLLDKMYGWRDEGLLSPILRDSVSETERADDIRQVVGRPEGPVITSNLDNDDGLARDFVERLRGAQVREGRTALYLENGLICSGQRAYLRHDPSNAFCAVREDLSDLKTCWMDWHNRLGMHMPVVGLAGQPGWLQVIHGTNVSNRVRGTIVDPAPYRALFGERLDGLHAPSTTEAARERLVAGPGRWLRDTARGNLRAGLVKVVGKDRFDALKYQARQGLTQARKLARRG